MINPPIFPYSWATDWGEDQYGLWMGLNHKGVHCVFRWIDPGTLMMGSPDDEKGRLANWESYHQVTLTKGFWIAETPVTQELWQSVMGENPSTFKGEKRPAESVSWNDCQIFIQQLNTFHSELEVRLPWEAEWEFACRAGTKTAFNFGEELSLSKANYRGVWSVELGDDQKKWSEELNSQWGEQAKKETTDVKSYVPNTWGLYDMQGNVFEWCQDHWQENLGTEAVIDPQNEITETEQGAERVVRGGSWNGSGKNVRSSYRNHLSPDSWNNRLGFRLTLVNPSVAQAVEPQSKTSNSISNAE